MHLGLAVHPPTSAVRFKSPLFRNLRGDLTSYGRVAFEADLPRIESASSPPCNRTTGAGRVNPPVAWSFYLLFPTSDAGNGDGCFSQLGRANIPGTTNAFGGTSTGECGRWSFLERAAA